MTIPRSVLIIECGPGVDRVAYLDGSDQIRGADTGGWAHAAAPHSGAFIFALVRRSSSSRLPRMQVENGLDF